MGIGPIGLTFGGDAESEVPNAGKSESNYYAMFRAKSVGQVGSSSVGIGPIGLKFGRNAGNKVPHEEKETTFQEPFRTFWNLLVLSRTFWNSPGNAGFFC